MKLVTLRSLGTCKSRAQLWKKSLAQLFKERFQLTSLLQNHIKKLGIEKLLGSMKNSVAQEMMDLLKKDITCAFKCAILRNEIPV